MTPASASATPLEETLSGAEVGRAVEMGTTSTDAFLVPYTATTERARELLISYARWPGEESAQTDDSVPWADWIRETERRMLRLTALPENWDTYGSPAPTAPLVDRIAEALRASEILSIPCPTAVPVPGGGIQLEWSGTHRELELEFGPEGGLAFLTSDAVDGEQEGESHEVAYDRVRSLLHWFAS